MRPAAPASASCCKKSISSSVSLASTLKLSCPVACLTSPHAVPVAARRIPSAGRGVASCADWGTVPRGCLLFRALLINCDLRHRFEEKRTIPAKRSMWPIDPDCWQVSLGAAFFIPTVIVPLLLITHGLIFRILLKHDGPTAYTEKTYRRKKRWLESRGYARRLDRGQPFTQNQPCRRIIQDKAGQGLWHEFTK